MGKLNCWEFKKCSREQGGINSIAIGICPSTTEISCSGINGGIKGGRICWAVAGSFCKGKNQNDFVYKTTSCILCDFFKLVKSEEISDEFRLIKREAEVQEVLK